MVRLIWQRTRDSRKNRINWLLIDLSAELFEIVFGRNATELEFVPWIGCHFSPQVQLDTKHMLRKFVIVSFVDQCVMTGPKFNFDTVNADLSNISLRVPIGMHSDRDCSKLPERK